MCTPTALIVASLAISAASAAKAQQGAKAQHAAQRKAAESKNLRRFQNAEAANKNFSTQIERSGRKAAELKSASAGDSFNARIEYLKARGAAIAAAGSAGIEGVSINDLMADFSATAGRNESVRGTNLRGQLNALHDDELDLHARTLSQRNSLAPAASVGPPPDAMSAGLQIAGAGIKAYQGYQASQPKTFTPTSESAGLAIQNLGTDQD